MNNDHSTISKMIIKQLGKFKAERIIHFFEVIKVPPDLKCLIAVIKLIIVCSKMFSKEFESMLGLNENDFKSVLGLLIKMESILILSKKFGNNWKSERPVYSLLLSMSKKEHSQHQLLLLVLFLESYLNKTMNYEIDINRNYLIKECRALRLSIERNYFESLTPWINLEQFLQVINSELYKLSDNKNAVKYLKELAHFFKGDRKRYKARVATLENYQEYRLDTAMPNKPEFIDDTSFKTFSCINDPINNEGIPLADCFNDIDFIEVKECKTDAIKEHPLGSNNTYARKLKGRSVTSKLHKLRNKTLMASSEFQPHHYYHLFNGITQASKNSEKKINQIPLSVVAFTCWLSIYTTKSVDEIKHLHIGKNNESDGIKILGQEYVFNFQIKTNVIAENDNRETHSNVGVPAYWHELISHMHGNHFKENTLLIANKYHKSLNSAVAKFLKQLSVQHDISITELNMQRLLVNFGRNHNSVDITAIDYAFGEKLDSTKVTRHYTKFDNEKKLAEYINGVWSLLEEIIKLYSYDFSFKDGFYQTIGRKKSKPIGAPFAPEKVQIQNLATELQSRILKIDKNILRVNIDELLKYHNNYVTNLSFILLHSTGYRAIYDPLPSLGLISSRHKSLTITDKNYFERISTRTIPITDIFLKQVEYYKKHVKVLVPLLLAHAPGLAKNIYSAIASDIDITNLKNKLNLKTLNLEHGPLFVLIKNTKGQISSEKVQPSWLGQQINEFDISINSGRHLLRSYLLQEISNVEVIDYFLGHAGVGENPHEQSSSFSFNKVGSMIKPKLEAFMEEQFWRAIPSQIC
jgi:hypothetical protein